MVEEVEVEGAGEVGAGNFYAGEVAVVADANLGEAEAVKDVFSALYLGEVFGGDGTAVLDAGGEAGAGGFVG